VKFWNLKSQHAQGELKLHGCWFGAYDPSATVIAVASPPTRSLLLYDVRNYDKQPFATFEIPSKVHTGWGEIPRGDVTRLEFSNDGKNILLGTSGQGHMVLDAFDGSLKHYLFRRGGPSGRRPPGHPPAGNNVPTSGTADVCLSPDGRFAIGGSGMEGMLVWDLHQPSTPDKVLQPRAELPGPGKAALVGYNHRLNLLCSADRDFLIWLPDPESVP
jgi:COMPASS component SWD2